MKFVLAGASGFLGTMWRDHLARQGHEVVRLVRGEAMSPQESSWNPGRGQVDDAVIESADVVACLSGAPLTRWPFTEAYKKTFLESRTLTTSTLSDAIARSDRKPAFLAQNGIAGYGDHGGEVQTEGSPLDADTFMGSVTRDWQAAAQSAEDSGARVVVMRTSIVLDRRGGALKPLLLVYKAGLGGPLGSGDQYFSTISLQDWLRAATWLAENDQARGAYNLTAPNPTTNKEFGQTLARMLRRPAFFKVPSFAIKAGIGDISSELLGSARIEPARLEAEGFAFDHPTLEDRLKAALNP